MNCPDLKPEQTELLRILKAYVCEEQGYEAPPSFRAFAPLFAVSLSQRVAPIVWHYLCADKNTLPNCPSETAAIWKAYSSQEAATQARQEAVFLNLYQVLRDGGLHPLVLKGVVCRHLYALPMLRVSCDEDILLQKEEFEEFDILIRACGFLRDEDQNAEEKSYTDPESALHVEVHFEPLQSFSAFARKQNAEFRDVFTRAEELDISGTKVLTPEPTKNLLYLILHQLQHFRYSGAGLRLLCDIVAFTEKYAEQIDREYLCAKLRELGLERYYGGLEAIGHRYLGLSAGNRIFPQSADGGIDIRDLLDDMFASGVHGTVSHTRILSRRITCAALDDSTGRGSAWKNLLFPSRELMYTRYEWTRGRAYLLPAAYAVRIVKSLIRIVCGRLRGSGEDADGEWIALGKRRVNLLQEYGILAAAAAEEANCLGRETFR